MIVLLDANAAHEPGDLPRILEPLLRGQADLVVGFHTRDSREPGSMSFQQVLSDRLATSLMRRLYGTQVANRGPLQAIRREDLLSLEMGEMTYGWSIEMTAKAFRAGYRYREVPVAYRRRFGVSRVGSALSGSLRAGWHVISATLRYSRWLPMEQGASR